MPVSIIRTNPLGTSNADKYGSMRFGLTAIPSKRMYQNNSKTKPAMGVFGRSQQYALIPKLSLAGWLAIGMG